MSKIGMREMLEAGAHFGHATHRWNPKMAPYIFGPRNGIHIIDLQQTVPLFKNAYDFLNTTVSKGGKVLFVGTKKQACEIIKEAALNANQYYVNARWLGGMLTNFKTIQVSIERFRKLETSSKDGTFERLPKKEVIKLSRELEKLEKNLSGIKDMTKPPRAIVIVDPKKEHIAVKEAHTLKIPIVAMVDTNCDPNTVNYPIPANDDSIRSVSLFIEKLANACKEGEIIHQEELVARRQKVQDKDKENEKRSAPRDSHKKGGPKVEVLSKVAVKEEVNLEDVVSEDTADSEEIK